MRMAARRIAKENALPVNLVLGNKIKSAFVPSADVGSPHQPFSFPGDPLRRHEPPRCNNIFINE